MQPMPFWTHHYFLTYPADTLRDNHVVITSKRRYYYVICSVGTYIRTHICIYMHIYSNRYLPSRVQRNPTALQYILRYALHWVMFHTDGVFRMQLNDHAPSIRLAWPSTSSAVSTLQCTPCEGVVVCEVFRAYHLRRLQAIPVDRQPSRNECSCKDQTYIIENPLA